MNKFFLTRDLEIGPTSELLQCSKERPSFYPFDFPLHWNENEEAFKLFLISSTELLKYWMNTRVIKMIWSDRSDAQIEALSYIGNQKGFIHTFFYTFYIFCTAKMLDEHSQFERLAALLVFVPCFLSATTGSHFCRFKLSRSWPLSVLAALTAGEFRWAGTSSY